MPLICPICGSDLARIDKTFKCSRRHSFDIAREGYLNLLQMRRKRKIMGDHKAMLRARRAFLERGPYKPLADRLSAMVHAHLIGRGERHETVHLVDVGCGEGHYLRHLQRYLHQRSGPWTFEYFGMDIAKEATRLAAQRSSEILFVVTDVNNRVVFQDASVEILLNMFAPRNAAEFSRVVAPGGGLFVVIPGPDHLQELRSQFNLMEIRTEKQQGVIDQLAPAFELAKRCPTRYTISLSQTELANLLQMTPNFWHLSASDWSQVEAITAVETTASFIILLFTKQVKF